MCHPDQFFDDEDDDEDDREADCGRWINGRLGSQCRLAGTEWCDWQCPIGLDGCSPLQPGDTG